MEDLFELYEPLKNIIDSNEYLNKVGGIDGYETDGDEYSIYFDVYEDTMTISMYERLFGMILDIDLRDIGEFAPFLKYRPNIRLSMRYITNNRKPNDGLVERIFGKPLEPQHEFEVDDILINLKTFITNFSKEVNRGMYYA